MNESLEHLPSRCWQLVKFNDVKYTRYWVDSEKQALYRLCYDGYYRRVKVNFDLRFCLIDDFDNVHTHNWKRFRALYFPEDID